MATRLRQRRREERARGTWHHPIRSIVLSVVSLAIATGAVLALAYGTGADKVGRAFGSLHPAWIALALAGQLLCIPAYVLAYRSVLHVPGAPRRPWSFFVRFVLAGFGPFMIGGGFDLDRRAARAAGGDADRNVAGVLAMAFLEWAVLAPVASAAAIVLLVEAAPIEPSLLWPWAILVPVGFALALWVSTAGRRRVSRLPIAGRRWMRSLLDGMQQLRTLITHPLHYAGAWVGTAAYWAATVAGFYGALRAFGLAPGLGSTVIAYATGHIGTRRSLPLGGAGVTDVFLVYALYWVNQPIAPALAAVITFRGLDFLITLVPGLVAYGSLHRRLQEQA